MLHWGPIALAKSRVENPYSWVCHCVLWEVRSQCYDIRELKQRRRQRQKSNWFRLAKQQLCTCIRLFCTFLDRRCSTTTWKCLIVISLFVEAGNTRQQLSVSFLKLLWPKRAETSILSVKLKVTVILTGLRGKLMVNIYKSGRGLQPRLQSGESRIYSVRYAVDTLCSMRYYKLLILQRMYRRVNTFAIILARNYAISMSDISSSIYILTHKELIVLHRGRLSSLSQILLEFDFQMTI